EARLERSVLPESASRADLREASIEEERISIEEHTQSKVIISNEQEAGEGSKVQRKPWQEFLRRHKAVVVALSVVFGLGSVGGAAWLVAIKSDTPYPNPAQLRFTQFEAVREQELSTMFDARFSPDGLLVAYAHTGDGQNIWVKQVNGGPPHRVTDGQWLDFSPIWSPDGGRIAFVSNRGDQFGVWTVPFLGGVVEPVKMLGDYSLSIQGGSPQLKSWSKDGRTIYYEWNHNFYIIDL